VLHLEHRVKVSFEVEAYLCIAEPPWKRFGAVEIVPWKVGMIKTEKIER